MAFSVIFNTVVSKSAVYKNTKAFNLFKKLIKNETLQAALILFLLVIIFLSTPLLSSQDHYYSAADFLQPYNLTQIEPNPKVSNGLLGDPTVIIQPWYIFNRESIFSGKIPLWNPYNGNGVPHVANLQSSVFSPFNIPLYIFTLRQALILITFLKLYSLGFFTYLFLKKIGLNQLPALVGGIAFMFSGTVTLWIGYPLPGAIIVLPAGLYFTHIVFSRILEEKSLKAGNENSDVTEISSLQNYSYFWPLVGLSLSMVAGILGGHPEIFYFSLLPVAAYIFYQLIALLGSLGFTRKNLLYILKLAGQFMLAGLAAVGLSALQLLPFFEYLMNSSVINGREGATAGNYSLPGELWSLLAVPTLLGNTREGFAPINSVGRTNFIEANTTYIGSLVLFLAISSFYFIRRDKYIRFFGIIAIIWIIYGYNILGLGGLFRVIPGLATIPVTRSQPIWEFCQATCAAVFLNYVWNRKKERFLAGSFAILICGLVFLVIIFIGIQQVLSSKSALIVPFAKQFLEFVPGQIAYFVITFAAGVMAVSILFLTKTKQVIIVISMVLIAVVFLQCGFLFKDFYPTIEDRFFYPVTNSIRQIQQKVGNKTLAIVGNDNMIADTNMVYKIALPSSYDGVWVKYFDQLYRPTFGGDNFNRTTLYFNEHGLKLFGIDYISLSPNLFAFGKEMFEIQSKAVQEYYVGEILPNAGLTQTFKSTVSNLQSVSVTLDPLARSNNCRLNFTLTEVANGKVISNQDFPCSQVTTNKVLTFNFEAIADSKDKQYKIMLTSPDSWAGNAVTAVARADLPYSNGQLMRGNELLSGGLLFGYTDYNTQDFKPVAQLKGQVLYQFTDSLSKYHFVNNASFVQSDTEAFQEVQKSDFDPAKTVIISGKPSGNGQTSNITNGNAKVSVISEEADRINLQVSNASPGYLVLNNSFYPGWKAKVNGQETSVLRANYAFSGIQIKDSDNTVEFYYDPDSFKYGWYATLATFIFGVLLSGIWLIKRNNKKKVNTGQI